MSDPLKGAPPVSVEKWMRNGQCRSHRGRCPPAHRPALLHELGCAGLRPSAEEGRLKRDAVGLPELG